MITHGIPICRILDIMSDHISSITMNTGQQAAILPKLKRAVGSNEGSSSNLSLMNTRLTSAVLRYPPAVRAFTPLQPQGNQNPIFQDTLKT